MLLAVLAVAATPPTAAQNDTPSGSPAASASGFSDTELKSFAAAALDVQRIREAYVQKLGAAADGDEQRQLVEAAARDMSSAVEQHGLSVERFHTIIAAARGDEALVARINKHLNE
jgi:hypothetical protein